jgi:hypothetical protein
MATSRKRKGTGRADGTEYQFRIDAYSPATIPMARLAQYMAELAVLFGERESVHFRGLTKGSTILNARIDREAVPKVRDRVIAVRAGDGSGDPMRAFHASNKLLRADNAVGVLRDAAPRSGVVIRFPGRELTEESSLSNSKALLTVSSREYGAKTTPSTLRCNPKASRSAGAKLPERLQSGLDRSSLNLCDCLAEGAGAVMPTAHGPLKISASRALRPFRMSR